VLSRLGEGGMGTVYLCEHAILGRRYAVKVLRPELGGSADVVERFRNEAIAASRVGGENVVDVLDFGSEPDGVLYYVMEALEGRSLGALVAEEGPLDVARALALVEQICRALGAAHARGVVHRDVKPDNVFVVRRDDGTERAKVIDFGISHVPAGPGAERLTRTGEIIGTPEYMAPEQAAGDPVDHRADVYALGVLAYEMLTGTLPIVATTPIATLVAHQTRIPEAPSVRRPGIPAAVDALVLGMLSKRPEDRPPSMDAVAAQAAALRSVPSPPPSGRRASRRAVAIALAVAAAAAAAALSGRARSGGSRPGVPPPQPDMAVAMPAPAPEPARPRVPGPEPARAAVAPVAAPEGPRHSVPPSRSSSRRKEPQREPHLEDPYAAGGLKPDPFE
jgi:serine/threonine-protein kinase